MVTAPVTPVIAISKTFPPLEKTNGVELTATGLSIFCITTAAEAGGVEKSIFALEKVVLEI